MLTLSDLSSPSVLYVLDLCGTSVFAVSGALMAGRKSMDLLGVVVLAVVTAIGGGTVRDLLLDRHPIFWIEDPTYLLVILASALLTLFYTRFRRPPLRTLLVADAFGLALFTIIGAQIAHAESLPALIVVIMATITGAAGGLIRDLLSAEIPLILRRDIIYATASLTGASAFVLLETVGLDVLASTFISMAVVVGLRLAAIIWGLQLPQFTYQDASN